MVLLTAELATKRLQSANASQDGIESISTWILHHTDSIRMLADCWLNLFRTEGEERRVVLFYIMNDVVQRAKKKHVDTVCSTFEQPVITAVSLGRFSEKLRGVMSRCLKLIAECTAFSAPGIERMNRIIADPNGDADDGNYEIDVIDLANKIEAFMKSVESITRGYDILKRAPQDFDEQIQTRMKDRKEGAILLKETRTSILRLERFREALANNNKRLYEFVDAIETAKRLFNMQLRDVAVVEDAYVKFGQGVREVQEEVEEMLRTGVYPAGSPPRDAPSPSAEDDVFSGGVEQVLDRSYKLRPHDVTDEADMEVDDDEPPPSMLKPAPARGDLIERVHSILGQSVALANHMGIDPRARANTAPTSTHATAAAPRAPVAAANVGPPPAKKPMDAAELQQWYARAAASIPSLQQTKPSGAVPGGSTAASTLPTALPSTPVSSFPLPPPMFAPNIPPPNPAVVAQFYALQQQQQQQQGSSSSSVPLSLSMPPPSMPPSVPPQISPFSAPPPGYPMAPNAAQPPQQQQQQYMMQQQQQHQQQNRQPYSPPAVNTYAGFAGGNAAVSQQYGGGGGGGQQGQKKYSTMPEYGRSNSNPGGPLVSPTARTAASGYYPLQGAPSTPGASTSAVAPAAGTPYTPSAPGLMGRKGSEGGGGYPRGGRGGQPYNSGYGNGYGGRSEEQDADAYVPQHRQDADFRQQQQYQPRGGGRGGFGRGNQGGGFGSGGGRFQRGGGPRGGGRGGFGGQQNYGGGYGNQGY